MSRRYPLIPLYIEAAVDESERFDVRLMLDEDTHVVEVIDGIAYTRPVGSGQELCDLYMSGVIP